MSVRIIKHSDIKALSIKPGMYMQWVKEGLLHQYQSVIPAKISIHLPDDGFFNTMPCYIPNLDVMGVKVVNRFIHNSPALNGNIFLFDATNGALKAILDESVITSMRTGAVAATSLLKLKSRTCENNLSIIGLGVTARATILCLLESSSEVFNIKLMRYKDQAEDFIERFSSYPNAKFTIVDTYKDLIVGADIILSCITSATEQIGKDEWFKEGVLLIPVHTRGFQNCDLFFDKVYGDITSQIQGFKYFEKFKYFNEFAKVLQGEDSGRDDDRQRILVYNIGLALHDIYIAENIYRMYIGHDLQIIDISEPLPKFYI